MLDLILAAAVAGYFAVAYLKRTKDEAGKTNWAWKWPLNLLGR